MHKSLFLTYIYIYISPSRGRARYHVRLSGALLVSWPRVEHLKKGERTARAEVVPPWLAPWWDFPLASTVASSLPSRNQQPCEPPQFA